MSSAARHGKDPLEEEFLIRLNAALTPLEQSLSQDWEEKFPTVHVIGVPRSGTTLATQLIATHLDIGYIDHLIAAFWKAPVVGIRLSRKLLRQREASDYSSVFGRTGSIHEPHEFGYFWRDLLGYDDLSHLGEAHGDRIDWDRVRRVLLNMTHAYERPIVFKSFWLSMHVERTLRELPRTCFVRIRRDPVDNALSLLRMRREFHGSPDIWASMKPREYPQLIRETVHGQLAGQVYYLQKMMNAELAKAPRSNVLDVDYAQVCARPRQFLEQVQELVKAQGAQAPLRCAPQKEFEVHRPSRSADPADVAAIEKSLESLARETAAGTAA